MWRPDIVYAKFAVITFLLMIKSRWHFYVSSFKVEMCD